MNGVIQTQPLLSCHIWVPAAYQLGHGSLPMGLALRHLSLGSFHNSSRICLQMDTYHPDETTPLSLSSLFSANFFIFYLCIVVYPFCKIKVYINVAGFLFSLFQSLAKCWQLASPLQISGAKQSFLFPAYLSYLFPFAPSLSHMAFLF